MKEIITITGDVGSGKSTVGKIVAESLGYRHISTGTILRGIADQRGQTIIQMNVDIVNESEIDKEIDSYIERISSEENKLVLDSRMAWHFARNTFNVYVTVDPYIGAQRVINDNRSTEEHDDVIDALRNNLKRKSMEDERFKSLYGVQCDEFENFDSIIDSTWVDAEQVANVIINEFSNTGTSGETTGYICPKRLYPTTDVCTVDSDSMQEIYDSIKSNGYDLSSPIEIIRHSQYFFILDGHKRASCALKLGLPHIPCIIHDKEELSDRGISYSDEVTSAMCKTVLHDWEETHTFSFASYPDKKGEPVLT